MEWTLKRMHWFGFDFLTELRTTGLFTWKTSAEGRLGDPDLLWAFSTMVTGKGKHNQLQPPSAFGSTDLAWRR